MIDTVLGFALMLVAGGIVGFTAPDARGSEGWRFWALIAAIAISYVAGKLV